MHGYDIALYLKQISQDVLEVEEGSLYPALQRLAIKGWLKEVSKSFLISNFFRSFYSDPGITSVRENI
jgi:hypothetical protein